MSIQTLNIKDTVTASVRTLTFNSTYIYKEHTFVIKGFKGSLIHGVIKETGDEAFFPFSSVQTVNGMSMARYAKSSIKSLKWDV